MSFIYNSFTNVLHTTQSYFDDTAKYCEDNNLNWTTTANVAQELATIAVWGPLTLVEEAGKATLSAVVDGVANVIPAWAYQAKDAAYLALATTWNADTDQGVENVSPSMAPDWTAAAAKALDVGYSRLLSVHTMLTDKADEVRATATELDEWIFGSELEGSYVLPDLLGMAQRAFIDDGMQQTQKSVPGVNDSAIESDSYAWQALVGLTGVVSEIFVI